MREDISEDKEREIWTTVWQGEQLDDNEVTMSWQQTDGARMLMVEWQGDDGEVGCT